MDSNSDSSDSEAENEQVAELKAALRKSPYYYEGHVELIRLLREQGDLDKAREARSNMRKIFPLTEALWLEWVRDEAPLTGLIAESVLELRLLFEAATEDYLSVKVWMEFAQFAIDKMSLMPEGVEFPRDVFERAVIGCGLHVGESGLLWNAYLEFEKAMLQSLQDMQMENLEDEDLKQQVEEQFLRVDKLYKRRLAVAHIGMEEAFQDYSKFCETVESMPPYERAKTQLEQYKPFEMQLANSDPPPIESYRSYLDHLISSKADPLLINTLYKRAVAHHCLDSDLWRDYLLFLDKNFRTAAAVLLPGYRLAVRNCTWESRFWLGLLRGLERTHSDRDEIVVTFEKALGDNFSSSADYLAVWLAYCDFYRRQAQQDQTEASHNELLALFARARSKLMEAFGKQGDPRDTLSRYHANMVKDVSEGRGIFDDIMTRHGKEANYWMDYITYVRQREGGSESCRKLFLKAVNSVTDDPERVCEGFLQFEREEGTLETYEAALTRTAAQMERIKGRKEKAAEKEALAKEELKARRKVEKKSQKKGVGDVQPGGGERSQGPKRKRPSVQAFLKESDEEGGKEESEGKEEREGSLAKKARVAESDEDVSEVGVASAAARLQAESAGDTKEGVSPAAPMETDGAEALPEVEGPKEQRTVFVSNLPSAVTKSQLRERFTECGKIVEVRLVHSRAKFNRTNTFAYIEFSSPAPVSDALSLDHTLFMEKNIYVSPFKERGRKEAGKPVAAAADDKKSDRMSKCTVYVNNLQRDITEQELRELFEQCGELKQVRLVKNQQGRSKGYAYVEFLAESSAQQAVLKLDNHSMGFKNIGVAISNPPSNKRAVDISTAGSGGVARGFTSYTTQETAEVPITRKSKISLVPRVLAKKAGTKEDAGAKKEATAAKSNDDFRKLFMNS